MALGSMRANGVRTLDAWSLDRASITVLARAIRGAVQALKTEIKFQSLSQPTAQLEANQMPISGSATRLLFCTICILFNVSAYAFDLNGAWTGDPKNCGKVFIKNNNKVSFTENADVNGGGFIFEGNQVKGIAMTCNISNRTEAGGVLQLTAACTTGVAISTMHFSIKTDDENKVTEIFPETPDMRMTYVRCAL